MGNQLLRLNEEKKKKRKVGKICVFSAEVKELSSAVIAVTLNLSQFVLNKYILNRYIHVKMKQLAQQI